MTAYGKSCDRCKMYFVSSKLEDRVCPWCKQIEVGNLNPDMLVELDAP